MAVKSLVQYFGGNRTYADRPGQLMGKQDLIGIPFAGGMSELKHLQARQFLVNDLNNNLHNLYWALTTQESEFIRVVKDGLYHPETLENAKRFLKSDLKFDKAVGYFVVNWLTRCSGGTAKETEGSLAMRWTASGGSSIARWNAAVEGLPEWAKLLRDKCEFTCLDWREWRKKWSDRKGHGIYADPPWIDAGDDYLHGFADRDHAELAVWLNSLTNTKVVVRHSDHHKYRVLYKEPEWTWTAVDSKNQAGNSTGEVLICNQV